MTSNKQTVQKYMDAFTRKKKRRTTRKILSCLTDESVETDHAEISRTHPDDSSGSSRASFHTKGKSEFDTQIEGEEDFTGHPSIQVTRMIEESDVVVAEGNVRAARKDGGTLHAVFCDVFVMRNAKIAHLTSYLMEVRAACKTLFIAA